MNFLKNIIIKIIKIYQLLISPFLGNSCRYFPTCSEYNIEALRTYGLFKGLFLGLKRVLSCHPIRILGGGEGFDPIKKKNEAEK